MYMPAVKQREAGMFNAGDEFSSCGVQATADLWDDGKVVTLTVPN